MARDHGTRANDKCPRLYVQNSAFSALSQKGGGARPNRGLTTARDIVGNGLKYLAPDRAKKRRPEGRPSSRPLERSGPFTRQHILREAISVPSLHSLVDLILPASDCVVLLIGAGADKIVRGPEMAHVIHMFDQVVKRS